MATRIESSRSLVGTQSISYIRPITLTLSLSGIKPQTQVYVYFDQSDVTHLCSSNPLYSDVNGSATFTLSIPGGRFTTGVKEIIVSDSYVYDAINQTGSSFGSAKATFTSNGVTEIYQTTQTTVNTETIVIETIVYEQPQPVRDPVAQSFFTYGVNGGLFITGIGLFFQTKDSTLPVRVELREMLNGYPSQLSKNETDLICSLNPNQIYTSNNASIETKFVFPVPIYLEENKDYCFVVFSNSNKYSIFTSKIGERSIENGKVIYTQPYVGSLFKSENNITWTAEQTEDIKFNIYKADFATNVVGDINLTADASSFAVPGKFFKTTSGSTRVIVGLPQQHGLEVNSYATIQGFSNGVYNGIANSAFTGNRLVKSVIDEFTFSFDADSAASKTGTIETSGQLTKIFVDAQGSGYESDCIVKIGSTTVGSCVVRNGNIIDVNITATVSPALVDVPTLTITKSDGTPTAGSGAILTATIDSMFNVTTNKPVNFIYRNVSGNIYNDTTIDSTITSTKLNYVGGNLQTYQPSDSSQTIVPDIRSTTKVEFLNNSVIASAHNKLMKMSNVPSLSIRYLMRTNNKNVSPVLDLRHNPTISAYSYRLRNQIGEDVTSTNPSGSIESVSILSGGSGYTTAPTITLVGGGGSGATATATLGTSSVSNILTTNGGSGYVTAPIVTLTGGGGSGATATAILSSVGVLSATVSSGGSGYAPTNGDLPTITFVGGGGGSGVAGDIVYVATEIDSVFVITNGGSGYTTAPTITLVGGGGSGATATATLTGDVVSSITLTNAGSGYTSLPTVVFDNTGTGGTGAAANCSLVATEIAGVTIISPGSGYTSAPTFTISGAGGTGASGTTTLSTRVVQSISVTNPGSNYLTAPTVVFDNTGTGGTGAAATAQISGKSIQSINITNAGSGYTYLPDVVITRNAVETGIDAVAVPKLTSINTEIGSTGGTNISRYLTKKISLEAASTGITLLSEIYSPTEANVDWYVRTSLSAEENHDTLTWTKLACDVDRNMSEFIGDFKDYKFYSYDLKPFDTYDLKCILRSSNPAKAPIVNNYRVIISV